VAALPYGCPFITWRTHEVEWMDVLGAAVAAPGNSFRLVLLVRPAGRSPGASRGDTGEVERWLAGWGLVLRSGLCRATCLDAKIQSGAAARNTSHRSARVCRRSAGHDGVSKASCVALRAPICEARFVDMSSLPSDVSIGLTPQARRPSSALSEMRVFLEPSVDSVFAKD
jgi:hypothetical protein